MHETSQGGPCGLPDGHIGRHRTPEGIAVRLASERRRYAAQTWVEHHAKQLKTRRLKAVQRMQRRASGTLSQQG